MHTSGSLYIVATPIGNLQDLSQRAIDVLTEVDYVAAEDTRHSRRLLQHHTIDSQMLSLHEHNEKQRASALIGKLQAGQSIALISDAGTPLISDPGYSLVNQCREAGISVVPIPGACAAITALCASGLPTDRFIFEGFLPVKQQAKQQALALLEQQSGTSIYYESPRRILDTLQQVVQVLGVERKVVLAKELTKTFETFFSGTSEQAVAWLEQDDNHQRGEFVLLIAGAPKTADDISPEAISLLKILCQELPLKKAAGATAKHYDLKKNQLYQLGLELGL